MSDPTSDQALRDEQLRQIDHIDRQAEKRKEADR